MLHNSKKRSRFNARETTLTILKSNRNLAKKNPGSFIKDNSISLFALIISLSGAFFSTFNYRDSITQNTIQTVFSSWMDLDKLSIDNWEVSHIYTSPEKYEWSKAQIHNALLPFDPQKQSKYLLKERMFAENLFDQFDMIVYLYMESEKSFNTSQKEYLKATLDYLTEKELRNQRLLYLWDIEGGKLCLLYEEPTLNYYNNHVLNNIEKPLRQVPDSIGPFYIDSVIAHN